MDGLSIVLWNMVLPLLVSTSVQGDFQFPPSHIRCVDNNLILPWNYTTNETVTVIEWYKQPGVLIARIFGVNHGAPFTVLGPYTTSNGYNVTQYIDESNAQYNCSSLKAAIEISGVSTNDSGIYSVNVTAASPQSAVLSFNYTADCMKQTTTEETMIELATTAQTKIELTTTSEKADCMKETTTEETMIELATTEQTKIELTTTSEKADCTDTTITKKTTSESKPTVLAPSASKGGPTTVEVKIIIGCCIGGGGVIVIAIGVICIVLKRRNLKVNNMNAINPT